MDHTHWIRCAVIVIKYRKWSVRSTLSFLKLLLPTAQRLFFWTQLHVTVWSQSEIWSHNISFWKKLKISDSPIEWSRVLCVICDFTSHLIRSRFPPLVVPSFFLPVQTTRFGSRIEESSSFEKCAAEIEWIGCLRWSYVLSKRLAFIPTIETRGWTKYAQLYRLFSSTLGVDIKHIALLVWFLSISWSRWYDIYKKTWKWCTYTNKYTL